MCSLNLDTMFFCNPVSLMLIYTWEKKILTSLLFILLYSYYKDVPKAVKLGLYLGSALWRLKSFFSHFIACFEFLDFMPQLLESTELSELYP